MSTNTESIAREKSRLESVYASREAEIDGALYAPWQPAESFVVSERKRVTAQLLRELGKFPNKGDKCLEIGFGKLGWLADLISWGLNETDLYGIELDRNRAEIARAALPAAHLEIGDATSLPWKNESFEYVLVSTVFSSILEDEMKQMIAHEIKRVLLKDGVLIWYDLAVNNPRNPNVKRMSKQEIMRLFPGFATRFKSVTLAPPIARVIAPRSWVLANLFNSVPFLRTHFSGVLKKGS